VKYTKGNTAEMLKGVGATPEAKDFWGVSATDPLTLIGVVLTVMLAGLFACFLPARRTTLVEPMTTLRNE
jgi:hypothetical protein